MQDVLMLRVLITILYNYNFIIMYHNVYTNGDVIVTLYFTIYDLTKPCAGAVCLVVMCWCPLKMALNNVRNM